MRGAVFVNGTITEANQAVIPVYDHGFVYGEGVYETLRTYNRQPFLYDRHVRRLRQSAHHLSLDAPFDDAALLGWIGDTTAAAGDSQTDARHHRQASRRSARARDPRRHPDLARRRAAQSSRIGQPDHQVEQS